MSSQDLYAQPRFYFFFICFLLCSRTLFSLSLLAAPCLPFRCSAGVLEALLAAEGCLCWWQQSCWCRLCVLTLLIGVRSLMCSSPIFHGCVNERLADRTPSPTFSTADSDITELADEQQDEMEDFDDEAFVDDTGSDVGTEEGSDLFNDGRDPFYDRSPWFILVGRLVRLLWEWPKGTSSCCRLPWLCLVLHRWSV